MSRSVRRQVEINLHAAFFRLSRFCSRIRASNDCNCLKFEDFGKHSFAAFAMDRKNVKNHRKHFRMIAIANALHSLENKGKLKNACRQISKQLIDSTAVILINGVRWGLKTEFLSNCQQLDAISQAPKSFSAKNDRLA